MKISGHLSGLNAHPPRPGRPLGRPENAGPNTGPLAGEEPRKASQDARRPGRTLPVERVLEGEVVGRAAASGWYDPFARARFGASSETGTSERGGHGDVWRGGWQGIAAYEAQKAAAAPARTARYVDCYV